MKFLLQISLLNKNRIYYYRYCCKRYWVP